MSIIYEDANVQVIETVTANGRTVQTINKPGSPGDLRSSVLAKVEQALSSNATFLGITNPSAAQNAAQVKILTRQVNGLIRLFLNLLDDVNDT